MKRSVLGFAYIIFSLTILAQSNVGIGTNIPETKLQVNGAISLVPADNAAASTVVIPDNVSIFRIRLTAGGTITALSVGTPKEGQLLTIYNQDDNAATFAGNSIAAITGVSSFAYINGGWRLTASNSASGPQGPQGPQGDPGAAGPQGPAGAVGAQGPAGPQGAPGAQGLAGNDGAVGPVGPQGSVGPQGAIGPQGPAGPQGLAGTNGSPGAVGPQGPGGPQGTAGAAGSVGPQGPAGPQGAAGAAGAQGPQGLQGPAGSLPNGSAAGNTTYWNGSTWVTTSNNIYNNGANVGIGTAGPGEKLHVNGAIRAEGGVFNSGSDHIELMGGVRADDNAYEWIGFNSGGTRQGIFLWDGAWTGANNVANEFSLTAEGSNLLTLNTQANHVAIMPKGGNVGIGTLSPSHKLHVEGDEKLAGGLFINSISPTIFLQDADNQTGMIHMNSNLMYFLSGSGVNTTGWATNGSQWPLVINMNNDAATFGGPATFAEGAVTVSNLAGTGNRLVSADAAGTLNVSPADVRSGTTNGSATIGNLRLAWGLSQSIQDAAQVFSLSGFSEVYNVQTTAYAAGQKSAFSVSAYSTTSFTIDRDNDIDGTPFFFWHVIGAP